MAPWARPFCFVPFLTARSKQERWPSLCAFSSKKICRRIAVVVTCSYHVAELKVRNEISISFSRSSEFFHCPLKLLLLLPFPVLHPVQCQMQPLSFWNWWGWVELLSFEHHFPPRAGEQGHSSGLSEQV